MARRGAALRGRGPCRRTGQGRVRHAQRATIAGVTHGNCYAGEVEQIAEVRVVPQHRVAVDGPLQYLRHCEGGADGGDNQHVHLTPQASDLCTQLLQLLLCGERVDSGVPLTAPQDGAHHWMDRFRLCSKEVGELDQSFGHPWPGIEQGAGLEERGQRRVHHRRSTRKPFAEGEMGGFHVGVAEEVEFLRRRQTDTNRRTVVSLASCA